MEEAFCTEIFIPRTRREALTLPQGHKWQEAMDKEIENMETRQAWTPVLKTPDIDKVIGIRWVFTLKNKDKKNKYKARLVALGNKQRGGIDYNET